MRDERAQQCRVALGGEPASAVEGVESGVALRVAVADVVPPGGGDGERPVVDGDGKLRGAAGDSLGVQSSVPNGCRCCSATVTISAKGGTSVGGVHPPMSVPVCPGHAARAAAEFVGAVCELAAELQDLLLSISQGLLKLTDVIWGAEAAGAERRLVESLGQPGLERADLREVGCFGRACGEGQPAATPHCSRRWSGAVRWVGPQRRPQPRAGLGGGA